MNRLNHRSITANRHNKMRATTALAAAALLGTASAARAQCPLAVSTPSTYVSMPTPTAVATGDFNADGRIDFAEAGYWGELWIYSQNASGTFTHTATSTTGTGAYSIATADFNGDGILDLVTANQNTNNASVLLGNGNGTFRPAVSYPTGNGAISVAIGDFNHDGRPDLVVANDTGSTVSFIEG